MAFREVRIYEAKEVLRLWLAGHGLRTTAQRCKIDRKTVRRYRRGRRGGAGERRR